MKIIPAIDIINGECVRLRQGDYSQKTVYHRDPLTVAMQFQEAGIKYLHLVDLDGAKAGKVVNWKVLETLATHTTLEIDFGGGIKTRDDVSTILQAGARLATIGSLAVKNRQAFLDLVQVFGPERFFLGADVHNEKLAVAGWQETTDVWVYDFINELQAQGLHRFFCTDIAKDGMLQGPSLVLYQKILHQCPAIELTASGGVSTLDDLIQLQKAGCHGAIVGKALYEEKITLPQLQLFL